MSSTTGQQVVICGGGPSGLAAAILFHQQGFEQIVVIERRKSHDTFERGKAFNYQLDARGQKMLNYIGIDEKYICDFGIANTEFVLNSFASDGVEKSFTIPFILPGKKTAYWITRSALLDMLHKKLIEVNSDNRIKLMYDTRFEGLETGGDSLTAIAVDSAGIEHRLNPQLVLGCDGVNSQLRTSMSKLDSVNAADFQVVATPSPSSNLMYKVVRLPREMAVSGRAEAVNDHKKAYVFNSSYKEPQRRLSLFSLPVVRPGEQRSANIILSEDHDFWKIKSARELTDFLKTGFPQLDIDHVMPPEELDDFIKPAPGKFPDPQYSPKVIAQVQTGSSVVSCVLVGDAAHAFPPDLGLGVNSALEDVFLLGREIEKAEGKLDIATAKYEQYRLPESRALTRLVKNVFPYQYNHVPWRFKLSMIKFLLQLGISKISGGFVDQPGFRLCQDDRYSYTELEKRIARTDAVFYAAILSPIAVLAYFASTAIS